MTPDQLKKIREVAEAAKHSIMGTYMIELLNEINRLLEDNTDLRAQLAIAATKLTDTLP